MKIWAVIAGCGLLILVLTACTGGNEVKIDAAANGGSVEVKNGQILVVALESNPTTGYAWEVSEVDSGLLQLQGQSDYKAGDTGGTLVVGAGGAESFRFLASGSGETTLKMVYRRSWETDVEPLQTFSVQVKVK
jgi:inhibitor of cysteine peptidase